ncbi:MAG: dihydroxyacetone kinase, partial [Frankiales bacterium]|nr:dihydroxyacetone kinase [Frankiales bacterium]
MLQVLDAAALRRWCAAGVEALRAAREEVDALNVYPVPDGDTGTNLLLTMQAAQEAVQAAGPDLAATVHALSRGALLGARGNSGVILSQLLRGLWADLPEAGAGPAELRAGLARAADLAWAAVAAPVEGTVLSVARAAAEGAAGDDLAGV